MSDWEEEFWNILNFILGVIVCIGFVGAFLT